MRFWQPAQAGFVDALAHPLDVASAASRSRHLDTRDKE
jgi:hypothetical protein